MENVIEYLEKEINLESESKPESNKSEYKLQWFIIKKQDFKNYDPKTQQLVSEVGKTFKVPLVDDKGNQVTKLVDGKNVVQHKTIHKTWSDVYVPYSKKGEVISIPNQRIAKNGKGLYYSIGINVLNKNLKVTTHAGNLVQADFDNVIKRFEKYDAYNKQQIENYHAKKEQELKATQTL